MTESEARQRIKKLVEQLEKLRYQYYVLDDPTVEDEVYDSLFKELERLEKEWPELKLAGSPTERVGATISPKFSKVNHSSLMLSLSDAFSKEDLLTWQERCSRLKGETIDSTFYAELKVDGLACSLIYQDSILVTAATRGDGLIGEDITQNVKTIGSIPLKLAQSIEGRAEIRGEIYMPYQSFLKLNKNREENGESGFANPRNAAAGSVRQLDPNITASRDLRFMAYQIILDQPYRYHSQEHQELESLGFKSNSAINQVCNSLEEVLAFQEEIKKIRSSLDYQIDGLVIQFNDVVLVQELGTVGRSPRGVIALKFPAEDVTTKLIDIAIQVGRQGTLTPVAILEPVRIGGVLVSRATLHNEDEINKKNILIGDTVVVRRAGDVIPEVVGVLPDLRDGTERKFNFPTSCPVCGGLVSRNSSEASYRCQSSDCFGSKILKLRHFTSKEAFDIPGLGKKVIEVLFETGLIKNFDDFFSLKAVDIEQLYRFGKISAKKIVESIQIKKQIPLQKFIYSLGIKNVGVQTAESLAKNFKTINAFLAATKSDLEQINDIGPVVTESIFSYLANQTERGVIDRLLSYVEVTPYIQVVRTNLTDKSIVITGTLESMSRKLAEERSRAIGAVIQSSVGKNTDYLVVGSNPGSKLETAQALGIKTISEQEFLKLLE